MVILEGSKRKKPLSIHYQAHSKPSTENGRGNGNFTSNEQEFGDHHEPLTSAVAVVLPRLLKHTTGFLKSTHGIQQIDEEDENNSSGNWMSNTGAVVQRKNRLTPRGKINRKVTFVSVTPSQMKEFFCLLGNFLLIIFIFIL